MTEVSSDTNKGQLRHQTINGIGWSVIAQVGKEIPAFITSVILARLLTPQDYGLVGMIAVFIGFASLFSEMGFGAALIQRDDVRDEHYSSVLWLNIGAGVVLTVLMIAAAPLIAAFYNEPRLTPLAMLIALNFLIAPAGMVQQAILTKRLQFRLLAIIQIITVVSTGAVAIAMVLAGYGVWSLVWQRLAGTIINVVALWFATAWRPRLSFSRAAIADLLGFSGNLFGYNIFNYWLRNLDNLLVGKFLGAASLGIYVRAYATMLLPLQQVTSVLGKVMFPSLSRIKNDKEAVKRVYLRAVSIIALITFPTMLGLFAVADYFVLAIYGEKWRSVIGVLQVLCLVGMIQSVVSTVGWIYQSQGRTDWMFKWGIFSGVLGIISFAVGVYIGSVEAVAWCYASANALLLYWSVAIPGKLINLKFGEMVSSVIGVTACAVAMAAIVLAFKVVVPVNYSHFSRLALLVAVGAGAYLTMLHLFKVKTYLDVKSLAVERWNARYRKLRLA